MRIKRAFDYIKVCPFSQVNRPVFVEAKDSSVTLGVMNSIVPANPVGIITALGGAGALVKQINGVIERKLLVENELEAQDFYFLWKLKNKK